MAQTVTGQLGAEGPYWDALGEGQLILPRCTGCGKWHWPAVWRCGACGSWAHEWIEQRLEGEIFAWTRTHHRFGGTEGLDLPFVTALVTLSAVPVRLQGLIESDARDPAIGAPVTGRVDRTRFGADLIPSIRWTLI